MHDSELDSIKYNSSTTDVGLIYLDGISLTNNGASKVYIISNRQSSSNYGNIYVRNCELSFAGTMDVNLITINKWYNVWK